MRQILKGAAVLSGGLAALVPIAKCPICAAAAAGVLGSLGIATIGFQPWFLPVVTILLLIGLWGFWGSAKAHRNFWPLIVATLSSGAVIAGRLFDSPYLLWSATGALVVAFIFDQMAKRKTVTANANRRRTTFD